MASWKRTLLELLAGIILAGMVFELVGLVFVKDKMGHSVGMLFGVIIALAMAVHMAYSLNNALDWDEIYAKRSIMKSAGLRYAAVAIAMGLLAYTGIGNVVSCFAGVMSLKASAYLQPTLHRFCNKYILKIEEEGGCADGIIDADDEDIDDIEDLFSKWWEQR